MTRLPNLFVPGTHKAGTTFLCAHLAAHESICFSEPKEPLFFSRRVTPDMLEDYAKTFFGKRAEAEGVQYIAEGSTTYFQNAHAMDNILEFIGKDIKAIICLRQPVSKAVSFYMHIFNQRHTTGRERLLELTHPARSIYQSGLYNDCAMRWIKAFGRENILFLRYDDLLDAPRSYIDAATDFLGIERLPESAISGKRINKGYNFRLRHDFLEPVSRGKKYPLPDWQTIPRIYRHELELLQAYFRPDIEKTAKTTGLDLSDWLVMPQDLDFNHTPDADAQEKPPPAQK